MLLTQAKQRTQLKGSENNKKAHHCDELICLDVEPKMLFGMDSLHRANIGASAAVGADIGIYYIDVAF